MKPFARSLVLGCLVVQSLWACGPEDDEPSSDGASDTGGRAGASSGGRGGATSGGSSGGTMSGASSGGSSDTGGEGGAGGSEACLPNDERLDILVDGMLCSGLGLGVDSSERQQAWLMERDGYLEMAYPSGQTWGAVFISTGGAPRDPPRPGEDISSYGRLVVELRGHEGGERVEIGIKDSTDLDNGMETKIVQEVSSSWDVYEFELSAFTTARLQSLYIFVEFVFSGSSPASIDVRAARFER